MLFDTIIRRKRDGLTLTRQEIDFFVAGLSDGSLPLEQVAALAMAIYWRSLDPVETGSLTQAMTRSGMVMDWSNADLSGPVVDKHSTGGVGDKVSLLLAPIVAACGGYVPMITGSGLGHTGGTLDKLSSIPGYDCHVSHERFRAIVRETGCAIIGQTGQLAPADKQFYAVRDVTATIESLPLICASILSKKAAAGITALVMDVKYGSGAFMQTPDEAIALSQALMNVGQEIGLTVSALVTDMNEVLGSAAGNAVEVLEAIDYLTGENRHPRLHRITVELAAEMLVTGRIAPSLDEARRKVEFALDSGAALERFARMVHALGGPADLVERHAQYLPLAPIRTHVHPLVAGRVTSMDVRAIGMALVELGVGRKRVGEPVDSGVGIVNMAGIGDEVGPERPLCTILSRSAESARIAAQHIRASCWTGDACTTTPLIHSRLSPNSPAASSAGG